MADPFIGEIRAVGFNYAPVGWAKCWGQLMAITQNNALFALLGTNYGGNGTTNFGLPDLRGRTIIGEGTGVGLTTRNIGEKGGYESVTLSINNLPPHTHAAEIGGTVEATFAQDASTTGATDQSPAGKIPAASQTADSRPDPIHSYIDPTQKNTQMASGSVSIDLSDAAIAIEPTGGGQPIINMQPSLVLNYIIATTGYFPQRQ